MCLLSVDACITGFWRGREVSWHICDVFATRHVKYGAEVSMAQVTVPTLKIGFGKKDGNRSAQRRCGRKGGMGMGRLDEAGKDVEMKGVPQTFCNHRAGNSIRDDAATKLR